MEKKYKCVSHQQRGDTNIWVFKKNKINGKNIQNKKNLTQY